MSARKSVICGRYYADYGDMRKGTYVNLGTYDTLEEAQTAFNLHLSLMKLKWKKMSQEKS